MMTAEALACFDRFRSSAFRLERLPTYVVEDEREEIDDWRAHRPRPEYSIRTSPWLARIATDTLAGKHWQRLRIVDLPLGEYLRWQLLNYIEAAATGEEIRIIDRASCPVLAADEDFWLFDADKAQPFAIAMAYDEDGRPGEHQLVTDVERLTAYQRTRDAAWKTAVPLNEFLASYDPLALTA